MSLLIDLDKTLVDRAAAFKEILNDLRAGMVDYVMLFPGVAEATAAAPAAGFVPFVVTNGGVAQQESGLPAASRHLARRYTRPGVTVGAPPASSDLRAPL